MAVTTQILLYGFLITFVMGAVAVKTNFCTMGAVSDMVNIGDTGRMRAWFFAMAVAIGGVALLQYLGLVDMTLTTSNDTSSPPYRTANFAWPRYILGGLIFGVGMTLGSGCGNKNLLRIGGGNIKSILVLIAMSSTAYLMIFTNFGYQVFLRWLEPLFIDFSQTDIPDQSIPGIIAGMTGTDPASLESIVAGILVLLLVVWAFKSSDFRGSFDNMLGGLVVGLAVVAAWYVTAGPMGQALLEEVDFMDERPLAVGAQSLSFVQPSGHLFHWISSGFANPLLSFALMTAFGVVAGALVYSVVFRKFHIEWFNSAGDFFNHLIGGLLMGIGGVLSMGCTIGQGVSGASTLALGSFITMASIIIGSALTMKIQFYKMVYEEEASFFKALVSGMADLKLLPNSMRKLDAV